MFEQKNSPILYMGSKARLVKKGLIDLFPKNIDMFVDVFAGSATVAMNTVANKYVINDTDTVLHSYYNMFINNDAEFIVNFIKNRVQEFGLPKKTTIRCHSDKQDVEYYKQRYHEYRDFYNRNKNPLDLYALMFFAFSQQFRVNKKGDFNMPFGNNHFSPKNEKAIIEGHSFFKSDNVEFKNKDFVALLNEISTLNENSFIYLDPPYSITTASYNENMAWTEKDDSRLFDVCTQLNEKGINFGMSNVILNKGIENTGLIAFCKENRLKVFSPINFQYHACGLPNKKQQEVFLCNYTPLGYKGDFKEIAL